MRAAFTRQQMKDRRAAIKAMNDLRAKTDAEILLKCPKCRETSGHDWSQCNGSCPGGRSEH